MKITRLNSRPPRMVLIAAIGVGALSVAHVATGTDRRPPGFSAYAAEQMSKETAPKSWEANRSMVRVPAGVYAMGRAEGPASERPVHEVRLEAFRIDRTEVTNAAFAEYLNALQFKSISDFTAGRFDASSSSADARRRLSEGRERDGLYPVIALDDPQVRIGSLGGRFVPTPGHEDHPVAETTWAGARAYCVWRGARLPSEAEWEAAARGEDKRLYPWGDAPPSDAHAFVSGTTGVTAPVGSLPAGASPFGALDMSGNLAEWTSTLKRPYPYDPTDGREMPGLSGERVTRGGDYRYDTVPERLTATHRDGFSNAPHRGHRHIGFRCAADL